MTNLLPVLTTNRGLLYNTDCFNLFAALKDESLDCIFADPKFNLGKDYGNGSAEDTLDPVEYLKWCFSWIDEFVRLVKPGGAVFIYILPQWGYHLARHLERRKMTFRHWIALSMKGDVSKRQEAIPGPLQQPVHFIVIRSPRVRRLGEHPMRQTGNLRWQCFLV